MSDATLEEQLKHIKEEYADFAYIVSHDLQAPLRHVKEFTRLLIGTRKSHISEEEKEYINFLEASLKKIDDMQQALLMFSRLNTRSEPMKKEDLNEILEGVFEELEDVISQYSVVIEREDLPHLEVARQQISLLFFNLLDNALKFHKNESVERRISIKALDQGDVWLFEISDNGIGIPEKFQEDVFRIFRRLEPGNYPGTGAGLPIVQKIVQRHGGDVIVESAAGEGTSVFFSIPKEQPDTSGF